MTSGSIAAQQLPPTPPNERQRDLLFHRRRRHVVDGFGPLQLRSVDHSRRAASRRELRERALAVHEQPGLGALDERGDLPAREAHVERQQRRAQPVHRVQQLDGAKAKTFFRDEVGIRGAYAAVRDWGADAAIELHFNAAGPTATPCGECASCREIADGENRSLEQAEQLRTFPDLGAFREYRYVRRLSERKYHAMASKVEIRIRNLDGCAACRVVKLAELHTPAGQPVMPMPTIALVLVKGNGLCKEIDRYAFFERIVDLLDEGLETLPEDVRIHRRRPDEDGLVDVVGGRLRRPPDDDLQSVVVALDLALDVDNGADLQDLADLLDVLPDQGRDLSRPIAQGRGDVGPTAPPLTDVLRADDVALFQIGTRLQLADPRTALTVVSLRVHRVSTMSRM